MKIFVFFSECQAPLLTAVSFMELSRRIIAVTHEFFPQIGGIATYVREMSRALSDGGANVEVWGPRGAGNGLETRYPVHVMPTQGNQDFLQLWKLHRYLKSRRSELIGNVLWLVEPAPIRALALFGHDWLPEDTKIWITFFGSELAQFKASCWWRPRVDKIVDRAEKVAFISEVICDDFLAWKPDYAGQLPMTRCGLRSDFRVETPVDGATNKESSAGRKIITISRIHPRKGHALVIEAVNLLPADLRQGLEYVIVGGGKSCYVKKLQQQARHSVVPVRFAGRLHGEALGRAYQDGDLFVLTSLPDPRSIESFGMVYLEAAAYGKPVIAARVGGVHEAIQDGVTGVLVPPQNPQALAAAMESLLRDPERMRRMGEQGRDWVKTFSWQESARVLVGMTP